MSTWDAVFLARHGQTRWNLQRRRQGRLDSPLTPDGVGQARRHGAALRGLGIDAVFASPMGRAVETARLINDGLGVPLEVVDDLAEVDHGEFGGLVDEQIDARFPGARERRAADKYRWRFPGGESYADADGRAARALDRIAGLVLDSPLRRSASRRPLIVSHEMIGRMLQRHLLGLDPDAALTRPHPHDVVLHIDPGARACRPVR